MDEESFYLREEFDLDLDISIFMWDLLGLMKCLPFLLFDLDEFLEEFLDDLLCGMFR